MSDPLSATRAKATRRTLLWVFALAVLVRLLYAGEHFGSPFFAVPLLDEKYYDTVARAMVNGKDFSYLNPGFRPLLYPAFLALAYQLAGSGGLVLATLLQHLLGILTTMLVTLLALRLHRRVSAAAAAGGLYALAAPPLYFEGEILITALFTFLVTVLLWITSSARVDAPTIRTAGLWLGGGAWIGLTAQARPNALLLLAAFPLATLCSSRDGAGVTPGLARRLSLAALPVAGAAAVMLLVALWQRDAIGRFQWLPSAGGINFYLGNKAGADGMIPRQDHSVTYGEDYRDSVQVFAVEAYAREHGGEAGPSAISRYWTGRTLDEIRADPGRWLALMGRKAFFLLWNYEIPNNKSFAFMREHESTVLRILPVRWALLLGLAAVGVAGAWMAGPSGRFRLFWILAFLGLYGTGVLLFFVNSRYRVPMWPAMAVLAGGALPFVIDRLRARNTGALAATLSAILAVAVLSSVNWLGVEPPNAARDFFFRSLAHYQLENYEAALEDARRSVELDPEDAAARFQLGNAALATGDEELAYRGYLAAASRAPDEPRVFNNLGFLYEQWDFPYEAYRAYGVALSLGVDYPPALVNAALLELRAGFLDRAEAKLSRAEDAGFSSAGLLCARAFLEDARGKPEVARHLLEEAERQDPEMAARLVARSSQVLTPAQLGLEEVPETVGTVR